MNYYQLKQLLNLLISNFLSIKYNHRQNQMFQFRCADDSHSDKYKEYLIKVEAALIIFFSEMVMWMMQGLISLLFKLNIRYNGTLVIMCKA